MGSRIWERHRKAWETIEEGRCIMKTSFYNSYQEIFEVLIPFVRNIGQNLGIESSSGKRFDGNLNEVSMEVIKIVLSMGINGIFGDQSDVVILVNNGYSLLNGFDDIDLELKESLRLQTSLVLTFGIVWS